jgi:hypothetical protein
MSACSCHLLPQLLHQHAGAFLDRRRSIQRQIFKLDLKRSWR